MVHPISYVFWIALGLATGEASAEATATGSAGTLNEDIATQRPWRRTALIALCACAIVASIPFRAARELAATNLAGVTYGLYDWTAPPGSMPSRLSGAQATLFVAADAQVVELSLTGTLPTGGLQTVRAYLDGHLANELSVGREPRQLRIVLSNHAGHARRIDLHVSPTWIPADVDASSEDHRTLGVRVGEVAVLRGAPASR